MRKAILISVLLAGCATTQKTGPVMPQSAEPEGPEQSVMQGYELLNNGYRKKAIAEFGKAIQQCDRQYAAEDRKIYASRGQSETLYYMLKAKADGQNAVVVAPICADALYLMGYASLDSGQVEAAEGYMRRAIAMSPVNSLYLSEMGHVHHLQRDWRRALDVFREAEKYAEAYSPEKHRELELARAKRGIGYSLIELGRLDEAEAKFKECLKLDSKDKNALQELEYIKRIRNEQIN